MKVVIILCVFALITTWAAGNPLSSGCIYIMGRCSRTCPEGTHSYTPGCGPVTPEATCDNPKPLPSRGSVCDYSKCYCDEPTVRDKASGRCVKLEDCP